ncbi:MAG: ACT domain-containing protein [Actinomycetota bacterium]
MAGMTDLDEMLRTLTVSVRPGRFTFVSVPQGTAPALGDGVEAVLSESEGATVVAAVERATAEGWSYDFEGAWLTIDVHSALEAVGLTATFSAALGAVEIPCNVLAAFHHDHLLVPADRIDDAITALEALRDR